MSDQKIDRSKIAVSHIAWSPEEETGMAKLLPSLGISAVEVAPARIAPTEDNFRELWETHGVRISSMQALLYGKNDLVLFDSSEKRKRLLGYLFKVIETAERLGAKNLVFGSPKNRRHGGMAEDYFLPIAVEFFSELGEKASNHGVVICIEANPECYGGDFIVTTEEAAALVRMVDSDGFGLHLDTGGILIKKENPRKLVDSHIDILKHVHISAPFLNPIYEERIPLQDLIRSLNKANYAGLLSIEMRSLNENANENHVRKAVKYLDKALSGESLPDSH